MARVKTLEDFSGKPAYMGVDVGKTSHWAYAVDAAGRTLLSRAVANDEADIRAALSGLPEGALVVVDQRKNIGALVLRTARSCGFPVAYLPGKAEHDLASALPGVSETDERDAEVIALAARGVPSALRPVPEEDPALEGARALAALRAQCQRQSTAWKNALRSRLLESCPAFERACDFSKPWCAALLAEVGGPWQALGMGRERFLAEAERAGAPAARAAVLWGACGGPRPCDSAVRAEAECVRFAASQVRDLAAEMAALDAAIAAELAGNRDHGNLQTIPGVGPATAAQVVIDVDVSDFASAAPLARDCGVVPADRRSGTSVRGCSAARGGNRRLKNLLVFSCGSLQNSRSRLGDYFRACRSRGMPYKAALKAAARKRIRVTYARGRDGEPYRA